MICLLYMIGGCHQNSGWIEKILLLIAGVDFSENPQMLIDLKRKFEGEDEDQFLIFDMKENTLWIAW